VLRKVIHPRITIFKFSTLLKGKSPSSFTSVRNLGSQKSGSFGYSSLLRMIQSLDVFTDVCKDANAFMLSARQSTWTGWHNDEWNVYTSVYQTTQQLESTAELF
jgi:hypothetical protein